jgi:hypothetical protein
MRRLGIAFGAFSRCKAQLCLLAFASLCITGFIGARATVIATSAAATSTPVAPAFTRFAGLAVGILRLLALVFRALLVTAFRAGFCVALGVFTPLAATSLAWSTLTALVAVCARLIAITTRAAFWALFLAFRGSGLHANIHVLRFSFGVKTLALRATLALTALVATTSTAATTFSAAIAALTSFRARSIGARFTTLTATFATRATALAAPTVAIAITSTATAATAVTAFAFVIRPGCGCCRWLGCRSLRLATKQVLDPAEEATAGWLGLHGHRSHGGCCDSLDRLWLGHRHGRWQIWQNTFNYR